MSKQKSFISWAFVIIGFFSLLLLFPVLISGGPDQDQKGAFLLNQMGFGAGCVICGLVLLSEKIKLRWIPLVLILFMSIKLGLYIAQNSLSSNGTLWLQRNNLLPWILFFLVYSEYYLIRTIERKPK
jgi:hypothetical protein